MLESRRVSPADVFVERPMLELAKEYLDRASIYDADKRAVRRVAQMLTAVEVSLFDAPVGADTAYSDRYDTSAGTDQAVLVIGEKTVEGVQKEVYLMDDATLELLVSQQP
ncbi:MAG TPA: hypothetical protein VMU97_02390 [Candidatus Dormibacteraeota bacterium]|nr:hypothetical protein [Candidatus Dormibacteraeota bacterium]